MLALEGMDMEKSARRALILRLMLIFVLGGILGWVYEMLFYRIDLGHFTRRGHGFGPWLPIYGFGSLFILFFTRRLKRWPWAVFLMAGLVTGLLEYFTGWALYRFWGGLRLWDYNTEIWNWGNIQGFVCLRSVLVFALAALGLVYGIEPALVRLSGRVPKRLWTLVCVLPFCLFVLDILWGYVLHPL